MNKRLLISFLYLLLYGAQSSFAKDRLHDFTTTLETDDCIVNFIECGNDTFVVKQIKDPSPFEQFLLVVDALGCYIAETSDIPMNKVAIIPSNVPYTGKKALDLPATLHTLAIGVSTDHESFHQHIDLHQRFRKENSPMWHRWGPLAPEKTGLTKAIIQSMAKHPDLPKIVAIDTFLGNADRSSPNLYYDEAADRFCGIDMAASLSSPLAAFACRYLSSANRTDFTLDELSGLLSYANTLEHLIENWPPDRQEEALLEYSEIAGFKDGSFLLDQSAIDRIEFHNKCIRRNYSDCINLIEILRLSFFGYEHSQDLT